MPHALSRRARSQPAVVIAIPCWCRSGWIKATLSVGYSRAAVRTDANEALPNWAMSTESRGAAGRTAMIRRFHDHLIQRHLATLQSAAAKFRAFIEAEMPLRSAWPLHFGSAPARSFDSQIEASMKVTLTPSEDQPSALVLAQVVLKKIGECPGIGVGK